MWVGVVNWPKVGVQGATVWNLHADRYLISHPNTSLFFRSICQIIVDNVIIITIIHSLETWQHGESRNKSEEQKKYASRFRSETMETLKIPFRSSCLGSISLPTHSLLEAESIYFLSKIPFNHFACIGAAHNVNVI